MAGGVAIGVALLLPRPRPAVEPACARTPAGASSKCCGLVSKGACWLKRRKAEVTFSAIGAAEPSTTSVVADVLDRAVALSDRAESYPLWARALFLVTLVLVLASLVVYAILFPRVSADDEGARPMHDPAP